MIAIIKQQDYYDYYDYYYDYYDYYYGYDCDYYDNYYYCDDHKKERFSRLIIKKKDFHSGYE